jgi:hypothetical protein
MRAQVIQFQLQFRRHIMQPQAFPGSAPGKIERRIDNFVSG